MDGSSPVRPGRLALILVIVNVALLAAGLSLQYWRQQPRPLPEFNAQLIRLLGQPGPSGSDREATHAAAAAPASTVKAPAPACLRITGLDQARYGELQSLLESVGLGPQQRMFLIDNPLGWWVFWPPEYEAEQREKVMRAIRAAGVRDAIPINKGTMAQAFSLGVFATEDQAISHRNLLRSRGLDKAEMGPRPGVAEETVHMICLLGGDEQRAKLEAGLPSGVKLVDGGECPNQPINPAH